MIPFFRLSGLGNFSIRKLLVTNQNANLVRISLWFRKSRRCRKTLIIHGFSPCYSQNQPKLLLRRVPMGFIGRVR
jgi:hypothetical protein